MMFQQRKHKEAEFKMQGNLGDAVCLVTHLEKGRNLGRELEMSKDASENILLASFNHFLT